MIETIGITVTNMKIQISSRAHKKYIVLNYTNVALIFSSIVEFYAVTRSDFITHMKRNVMRPYNEEISFQSYHVCCNIYFILMNF